VEHPGASELAQRAGSFRLGFVPGATPAKWARVFRARHPEVHLELVPIASSEAERALLAGELDAAILRPPVDRELLHAIPLYVEEAVVVVGRDHLLAALGEDEPVEPAELDGEVLLRPADDVLRWAGEPDAAEDVLPAPGSPAEHVPESTAAALELVAAGVGVLVVPRSIARLYHRKDVTARTLAGGPPAPVALAWAIANEDERVDDLVGIVRGRTVNSSRGRPRPEPDAARKAASSTQAQPRAGRRGAPGRGGGSGKGKGRSGPSSKGRRRR